MFRPELVRKSPTPLSSDAFTAWGAINKQRNNADVIAISSKLLHDIVPALASSSTFTQLEQNLTKEGMHKAPDASVIKQIFHEHGINLRFNLNLFIRCPFQVGSF